jgi:hypothetical protein
MAEEKHSKIQIRPLGTLPRCPEWIAAAIFIDTPLPQARPAPPQLPQTTQKPKRPFSVIEATEGFLNIRAVARTLSAATRSQSSQIAPKK